MQLVGAAALHGAGIMRRYLIGSLQKMGINEVQDREASATDRSVQGRGAREDTHLPISRLLYQPRCPKYQSPIVGSNNRIDANMPNKD